MADRKIVDIFESAEDSSASVDYSQLREGNIWDVITTLEEGTLETGGLGQQGLTTEEEATPPPEPETSRVRNGTRTKSPTQMSDMEKIFQILQKYEFR